MKEIKLPAITVKEQAGCKGCLFVARAKKNDTICFDMRELLEKAGLPGCGESTDYIYVLDEEE